MTLKQCVQEDIECVYKGFVRVNKPYFRPLLLGWCDVIDETLQQHEFGLDWKYGEMWQIIQAFREKVE